MVTVLVSQPPAVLLLGRLPPGATAKRTVIARICEAGMIIHCHPSSIGWNSPPSVRE
jgi:hypothetical protein